MAMKKIYCIKYKKYRKFKNPKIPYIFDKTLIILVICGKHVSNYEKYLNKKNQLRY